MNKLLTKIVGAALGLTMAIGVGVAVASNSKEATPVHAAGESVAYEMTIVTGGSNGYDTTSTDLNCNGIKWSAVGNTTMNPWRIGGKSLTNKTRNVWSQSTVSSKNISKVELTVGNASNITVNSVKLLVGTSALTDSSTAGTTSTVTGIWAANSDITFDRPNGANWSSKYFAFSFNVTVSGSSNKFLEFKSAKFYYEAATEAYVSGNSSVDVNSEYTATVKKTSDDSTVSGTITYVYTPSNGAVLSSPTPDGEGKGTNTTGKFTASSAGKVTISATLSGYTITSKEVTVNSLDPYINLSLTSSATAFTGQTVTITSEYGNGVTGLTWTVESGAISGAATSSNSGFSAKIGGNDNSTLTIRATDTGSALYEEVSVSVTKTAFTTSPAASASVAEGKTTTLSAVLNSGGTINWDSDDHSVATVSAGVVTGVAAGTATITAQSADDTSVTATCTVTVTEAPAEIVIDKDSISGFASSYAVRDWTSGTVSGKIHAYKNGNNIQFQASNSYMYNTVAVPGPITNITLTKASGSYTQLTLYTSDSAITSQPASGGVNNNSSWSWDLDADDGLTYFYIKSSSSSAKVVSDITITYQKVELVDPTGIALDNSSAISMDTYGYGRRKLSATVSPYNANNLTVTWGTNNSSVVTVADGVLTPVGVGTTTVYACTANYDPENPNASLIDSVSVTVTEALYKKATFTPTSTSVATQSDDYLTDGSVTLSASSAGTWNNDKSAIQLTSGKDVTFTISGYAGMKISGVDLVVSSNGSAGSAALTVTAGITDILEIESAAFNDASWNGAYDANACELYKATTEYVVDSGEDITFAFSASVNSIYVHSVAIRYLDYSLEQWCENFLNTITCDGVDSITDDSDWDDLGIAFLDLDSDLQTLAANATANKNSDSVIERAMARYDLIIRKYGTSAHDDFIGRFGEGTINGVLNSRISLFGNIGSNNAVAIIVVVSMISLTSIGGYFFLRKRKEQ